MIDIANGNTTMQFGNSQMQLENAYYETLEVLSRLNNNDYNKIPPEVIQNFETYKNTNCEFRYDDSKKLYEQNISSKTKEILAMLFVDYFADEKERSIISAKQKEFRIKKEEKLKEKYDVNQIFKKRK